MLGLVDPSWYREQLRTVFAQVQDPAYASVTQYTPVLEILIRGAELGPLPEEVVPVQATFVRVWVDGEPLGETSLGSQASRPSRPSWNERLLCLPAGARTIRFEVCEQVQGFTAVRCYCALAMEGLWEAVRGIHNAYGQRLTLPPTPLLHMFAEGPAQVGLLDLSFGVWDHGPPRQESQGRMIRPAPPPL
eukprot:TRINITY_DN50315_c0_g1_i1.p1 TRINITY_DN50315_c0_g1~~TRINITY_DN50315_c0_g1_i1.p1  ORF type:complete len:190 (-),score=27.82 TRINITY_DN50315_c0_g1_i1:79-648(-)